MAQKTNPKHTYQETERSLYWRRQIRSWERSGLTQRAFCEKRGLSLSSFVWWKSELKNRASLLDEDGQPSNGSGLFVPVHVEPAGLQTGTAGAIEVSLPSGPVLRIPAGFDTSYLIRLLDVLEPRC